MPVYDERPRSAAVITEASFCNRDTAGLQPFDWAADGAAVWLLAPDTSSLAVGRVANENMVPRPTYVHRDIQTLRASEFSFGAYMHGSPVHAAAGDAATTTAYPLAQLLRCALGGMHTGSCRQLSGGTTTAPTVASATGMAVGDWHFFRPAAAGSRGQLYRITAISGTTLTLDRELHFDPAAGDLAHAVIEFYLHPAALTRYTDPGHKTLAFVFAGDSPDDTFEVRGVKLAASVQAIEPGTPTRLQFAGRATSWARLESAPTFGSPAGEAGSVPSVADTTHLLVAPVGQPLAPLDEHSRGAITPNLGVTHEPIPSATGVEGVAGYRATGFDAVSLALTVPFDPAWLTADAAGTEHHLLLQVGDTLGALPWGLYVPQGEIKATPSRATEGGLAGLALMFRGRENATASSLEGDALARWRSPITLLVVA